MTATVTTLRTLTRDLIASLDADKDTIQTAAYPDDLIHEYVDSTIPVYNWELAECRADNPSLAYPDDEGLLPEKANVWQILMVSISEQLTHVAYEWLEDNFDEGFDNS